MNVWARIRQLVIGRRLAFTQKVDKKLEKLSLTRELVGEAIINAPAIYKTVRVKNARTSKNETHYVIRGMTFDGKAVEARVKIEASRKTGLIEQFQKLVPPPTGWK
jgi:hypothetical protein